ncbi:MAG: hypothetical protein RI985_1602 [Chloroflexota bacterium]
MYAKTRIRWKAFIGTLIILMGTATAPVYATDPRSTANRLRSANPTIQIDYQDNTGLASFVYAPDDISMTPGRRSNSSPVQTAQLFINEYGAMFGVTQANELSLLKEFTSPDGDTIVRFQQVYQNIPVVGAQINFGITAARTIRMINGEMVPRISLNTSPVINVAQAIQTGLASVRKEFAIDESKISITSASLAIFDQRIMGGFGPPTPTLTWQVRLTNRQHLKPFDAYVFVDATHGQIVTQFNQIAHALNQRICDNNNVLDPDDNSRSNCDDDGDATRLNSVTPSGIQDVDDAWEFTKATYDYFYTKFGRDGIDGSGMTMISIVRYCLYSYGPSYCPFENAYWDGEVMTYGEGFSSADDVIAHEITHGITERTANLYYYFQSGAINEAISDIFGEFVDQNHIGTSTDGSTYNWQLGEDLPASIGVIRNLRFPTLYFHPDRMTSEYYDSGFYYGYDWPQDNGGVHTNSGVANKAAYLMVAGGRHNGQSIVGLGKAKTEQIWYRVLVNNLLSASDYTNLASALIFTCKDMVNRNIAGMTLTNCDNVNKVVLATEMRKSPTNAPAFNAPMCSTGLSVRTTFFDNMESFGTKWSPTGRTWYNFDYATSGSNSAYGLADANIKRDLRLSLRNSVYIPANAYLHFNHAYDFASANLASSAADVFFHGSIVEYSINNGSTWKNLGPMFTNQGYTGTIKTSSNNVLKGQRAFVGVSNGFISSRANLSTLAGKRIKLRFRYTTDGVNYAWNGWWIDDIRIYTCR